jgi:adenylate kinase family enzyme
VRRIAVVGSGGSGKTTFARELGRRTGLPVIHLDHYFWKPGWVQLNAEEWRATRSELLAGDAWIADGEQGGSFDVQFSRADTVVVLALDRVVCLTRALKRCAFQHGQDVQAPGCPAYFDRDLLRWVWCYPKEGRRYLDDALTFYRGDLDVVELTSCRAVSVYLANAGRVAADVEQKS